MDKFPAGQGPRRIVGGGHGLRLPGEECRQVASHAGILCVRQRHLRQPGAARGFRHLADVCSREETVGQHPG